MNSAMLAESQRIAEELYSFLQTVDPVRWRADLESAARERLIGLKTRVRTLLDTPPWSTGDAMASQLQERLRHLASLLDDVQLRADMADEFRRVRARLQPAYAAFAAWLQSQSVDVPNLRPTNHARSLFHVATGLTLFACVQHIMDVPGQRIATIIFVMVAWFIEWIRRARPEWNAAIMIPFKYVAHPHEHHRVNSATWYGTAMLLLAFASPVQFNSVGILVLAFADPAAALIGRRYGRHKIVANRSLEGSVAFVVTGWLVGFGMFSIYYPQMPLGTAALAALGGALAGALAELFSRRLDDNFTIPIAAALGSWLLAATW